MTKINGLSVKREMIGKRPKGEEATALLSGFVRACFSIYRHDGECDLWLDCQTEFVREYIASMMMEHFMVTPVVDGGGTARRAAAAGAQGIVEVTRSTGLNALVFADGKKLLEKLRIIRSGDGFELVGMDESFASFGKQYVRGVFLATGSLSVPDADAQKSGGYHLEFTLGNEQAANDIISVLNGYGIWAHLTVRNDKYVVYVKDSENVCDGLALLGAEKTVLKLNETIAVLTIKREVTRRNNCDIANINRSVDASLGVQAAIEKIAGSAGLDTLDAKLKAAAEARLAYPDASLGELAGLLGISKSGLKHRLDKLIEIAASL